MGNFQGTYVRRGNPWDLKNYRQKPNDTLMDCIQRFSRQCNKLANLADADVINVFVSGTMSKTMVHKLGRKSPRTTKELLDITTTHASGEYAMGAMFNHRGQKAKRNKESDGDHGGRPDKRKKERWRNDKVLVVAAGQKGKKSPTEEAIDHFEKLLEAPCLNHRYPVQHAYKDYGLVRKFLGGGASPEKGAEPR
jgi:hypothetical protein